MSHNTAHDHVSLLDSFDSRLDNESGIRRRRSLPAPMMVIDDPASEPTAVHMNVRRGDAVRRYYLGVRFDTGVIPAQGWEQEMQRDGVSAGAIRAARRWLQARTL